MHNRCPMNTYITFMASKHIAGINGWSDEASKYNFAAPGYTPAAGHFTCARSPSAAVPMPTGGAVGLVERGYRPSTHHAASLCASLQRSAASMCGRTHLTPLL